jgi:hypothetical protein
MGKSGMVEEQKSKELIHGYFGLTDWSTWLAVSKILCGLIGLGAALLRAPINTCV